MEYHHQPVLLEEVLQVLSPKPGENFVDATLGGGGYSRAIAERIKPGRVLAIDLDRDAIENFGEMDSVTVCQGNFREIDRVVERHAFPSPDGIVADLGLSSYELEHRGISFQADQPLDMRFDQSQDKDAKWILHNYSQQALQKIFEDLGEEKFSRQIAKKIQEARDEGQGLKKTGELYKIIQDALPKPVKHKASDSARRIFQALRMEVNHELESLRDFLPKAFDLLAPGGRMAVVSFHSLEDREVKQFFSKLAKGCVCPQEFPQCICGRSPQAKLINKKPLVAAEVELKKNSRAKSAKLRAIIKL